MFTKIGRTNPIDYYNTRLQIFYLLPDTSNFIEIKKTFHCIPGQIAE